MKNRDWINARVEVLPKVHFDGREFELSIHRYAHAPHLCMRLTDERGHYQGLWASAVYATDAKLGVNEILVHEREPTVGMLSALGQAGVVRATGRYGSWHGLRLPVAELLVEPPRHLVEGAQAVRDQRTQGQVQDRGRGA